jgi:hypothetical protein
MSAEHPWSGPGGRSLPHREDGLLDAQPDHRHTDMFLESPNTLVESPYLCRSGNTDTGRPALGVVIGSGSQILSR